MTTPTINDLVKMKEESEMETRRCVCGFCTCDYKLEGYAANEDVCGACLNVCYEEVGK